ncbi:MAG: leucine-rich repeat domain-containing protein [Eubacteriales bacterium]|nr:leucine-rich repeat domain-containing protein [Eubacteriales bacterium]
MTLIRCMKCMREFDGAYEVCLYCGYKRGLEPVNPLYLPEGTVLDGKYLIGTAVGHGGFGITYVAFDLSLDRKVAIKEYFPYGLSTRTSESPTVLPMTTQDAEDNYRYGREKFIEEARTLARFNQLDSIVYITGYFSQNNTAYIVMEYLDGVDLLQYIKSRGGKISWEETLHILAPVFDALMAIHAAGMIHRDISPDNIFITIGGKTKLLDFGTARFAMGEKSKSLSVILKPGYAPTEQYSSRGKQGPWTDVYALAATIYRAVTGEIPVDAVDRQMGEKLEMPDSLGAVMPPNVKDALMRALSLEPGKRPQTIAEFRHELYQPQQDPAYSPLQNAAEANAYDSQPQPIYQEYAPPKQKKNTGLIWAIIAGVLACIAITVVIIIFVGQQLSYVSPSALFAETPESSESAKYMVYTDIGAFTCQHEFVTSYMHDESSGEIAQDGEIFLSMTLTPADGIDVEAASNYFNSGTKAVVDGQEYDLYDETLSASPSYEGGEDILIVLIFRVTDHGYGDLGYEPYVELIPPSEMNTAVYYDPEMVVDIPDEGLREGILQTLDQMGEPVDGDITVADMQKIEVLFLVSPSCLQAWGDMEGIYISADISSLSGLEYATNMSSLTLPYNSISQLNALSELKQLTNLDLQYNNISDINGLSDLTGLTSLNLHNNDISDLSALSELTGLTNLILWSNNISDIWPLERLASLTYLDLDSNSISDLRPLEGLTNLNTLYLSYNSISDIGALEGLTNLNGLFMEGNSVSEISALGGLTNLVCLGLGNNSISEISALERLTNLNELYISGNCISDIGVLDGLTNLTYLSLDVSVYDNNLQTVEKLEARGCDIYPY